MDEILTGLSLLVGFLVISTVLLMIITFDDGRKTKRKIKASLK